MIEVSKQVEPLSFKEHCDRVEVFVEECNRILRNRGFRLCEAAVQANWFGQASIWRSEMIDREDPQGKPVMVNHRAYLVLPWTVDGPEVDAETILNYTLGEIEKDCAAQCSRAGVVRISFTKFAKQMKQQPSSPETIENGRSRIVTP